MSEKKIELEASRAQLQALYSSVCGLPDDIEINHSMENYSFLDDWGFFHLTIPEAAELTIIDMWFSGEIDGVDEPEGFDGDTNSPWLKNALSEHIKKLEQQMICSISSGLLTPDLIHRDMDDNIISEETYIAYGELTKWLEARRYWAGDVMAEWHELQTTRVSTLFYDVKFYRVATKSEIRQAEQSRFRAEYSAEIGLENTSDLEDAYKAAIVEIQRLKKALSVLSTKSRPDKIDRPVSTRQRRTMLTIIAALCDYSAIKPNERGSAVKIAAMTEEIGAAVGAETIVGLLREIPEAIETRMK